MNPIIWADVPDPSVIRVGDTFYMVSTTMHASPGCPIMKSKDLVNWEICGYAHDQLEELDAFSLKNGQNDYAKGSWTANLRHDPYEGLRERAAELLKERKTNISQVGYTVGFSSPGQFSDSFRKYFGCSPSEYIARETGEGTHENDVK